MTLSKDEQFDPDESDAEHEFERMRDMLHAHIADFAEEHDLPLGALSPLLLDLDRMARDVQDFVRDCKRHADEFIAHSKDAIQAAAAEMEGEAEDQKPAGKP